MTAGYYKLMMAATLTLATSSQGLLTTASKSNGEYRYNFATVPFLAEVLKLVGFLFLRSFFILFLGCFKFTTTPSVFDRSERHAHNARLEECSFIYYTEHHLLDS